MKNLVQLTIVVLLCLIALFVIMPLLSTSAMGTGSLEAARQWKALLASCKSPSDVNQLFSCGYYTIDTNGVTTCDVQEGLHNKDLQTACIFNISNGEWLAVAYEGSHRDGDIGGTVVTLDSYGNQKVYFGHVCGSPGSLGTTVEDVYSSYGSSWKEIDLNDIEHAD